jgi:hypothetical protein
MAPYRVDIARGFLSATDDQRAAFRELSARGRIPLRDGDEGMLVAAITVEAPDGPTACRKAERLYQQGASAAGLEIDPFAAPAPTATLIDPGVSL